MSFWEKFVDVTVVLGGIYVVATMSYIAIRVGKLDEDMLNMRRIAALGEMVRVIETVKEARKRESESGTESDVEFNIESDTE